ncbi:MAG: hypothetical protein ACK47B_19935 [Armatimonadota bacterium]
MTPTDFWLDIGAGSDAEHWAATPAPPGVRRIALDPLITSGRVRSGTLAPLPADVLRLGAELRPPGSVDPGKEASYLPFRSGSLAWVHCGYVLHLFLELRELLAAESHRVLRDGGELTVLLPHFGESRSDTIIRETHAVLQACFGSAVLAEYRGAASTFWADLYRGRSFEIRCVKRDEARAEG